MEVEEPLQMDFALPTVAEGAELTVIFTLSILLQPEAVIVSVNL